MPYYKVLLTDQGHEFTRVVRAVDKAKAIQSATYLSYAKAIDVWEVDEKGNKIQQPDKGTEPPMKKAP